MRCRGLVGERLAQLGLRAGANGGEAEVGQLGRQQRQDQRHRLGLVAVEAGQAGLIVEAQLDRAALALQGDDRQTGFGQRVHIPQPGAAVIRPRSCRISSICSSPEARMETKHRKKCPVRPFCVRRRQARGPTCDSPNPDPSP
jgi:hypothetical protein